MVEQTNPVLRRINEGKLNSSEVEETLSQYSLLPRQIVQFLFAGASRLQGWEAVATELHRNIGEEEGSRTDEIPHYIILKDALLKELALDITNVHPAEGTKRFLNAIEKGLSEQSAAFAAGMLYALEDSAVPELAVVANIINKYALLVGQSEPIDLVRMSRDYKLNAMSSEAEKYCLNLFFASHMLDFEIGHKNRLASAIQSHISQEDIQALEEGFEYVLDEMDMWWGSLARAGGQGEFAAVKSQKKDIYEGEGALMLFG
jgi:hypothetical protein